MTECKFTPLGFETEGEIIELSAVWRVNLPRWGLKQIPARFNLDRRLVCKFTPLGFETKITILRKNKNGCVNLPRWGLKPEKHLTFK